MSTHRETRSGRARGVARVVAAVAAGVMALTAYAAPAHAADRVVRDRGGADDSAASGARFSQGELRALRVRYTRDRLVVRFVPGRGTENSSFYTVFVDTDRDGRPERRIDYDNAYGQSPFAAAYRADGFAPYPNRRREVCGRVPRTVEGGFKRPLVVTVRVPLRCLGGATPAVRVTGFTAEEYGISDWVPGPRRFSAPIRRG